MLALGYTNGMTQIVDLKKRKYADNLLEQQIPQTYELYEVSGDQGDGRSKCGRKEGKCAEEKAANCSTV